MNRVSLNQSQKHDFLAPHAACWTHSLVKQKVLPSPCMCIGPLTLLTTGGHSSYSEFMQSYPPLASTRRICHQKLAISLTFRAVICAWPGAIRRMYQVNAVLVSFLHEGYVFLVCSARQALKWPIPQSTSRFTKACRLIKFRQELKVVEVCPPQGPARSLHPAWPWLVRTRLCTFLRLFVTWLRGNG